MADNSATPPKRNRSDPSAHERRRGVLRRHAKEVRNYKVAMKALTTAMILILTLLTMILMVSALYKRTGSFTISLNKVDMQRYGLTLYDNRDLNYPASHLNANIQEDITNITASWLPSNIDSLDGAHNGDNYIAYTFYLQNSGTVPLAYVYSIKISNISNQLDECIRVRLYKDGVPTTYAKAAADGSGLEPDADSEFYGNGFVAWERVPVLEAGEVTKFTIVIWIEGTDQQCTDPRIDGSLRLEMMMEVEH